MNIITTLSILCIAALSTSAVAMSAEPISDLQPTTPTTLGSAAAPQPPTVNVEKSDLQSAAGEKFDPSEIRQALSELLALKEGAGSNQQIQEKKATLKAAVERGIKKDPKSVLSLLFGFTQVGNTVYGPDDTDEVRSFIQRDPELAITLPDQLPDEFGRRTLAEAIGSDWAETDLKAAFAWANQQTDSKMKSAILEGVISSWAKTDLKGAFAYAQSLPPGNSQDRTISKAFEKNSARGYQGAIAMMQSLPEGRIKDLAARGISDFMSLHHPRAAWDLFSGIGDSRLRSIAEQRVLIQLSMGSLNDPVAATQWMQSLPKGDTKDMLSEIISGPMAVNHPQAAFDIAAGIGDSNRRTKAQKKVVKQWSKKDPDAATQWINRSALPQEVKTQLLGLAASNAPAQNPTPSQPPGYVDEAPLPKGWPKPGPYDQVSEKSYPSYRAAFTTENRENGAFRTLFSHIQKNDIPMTAPVEISMAEGDGQNLRQTTLAFLYQDTSVGKTGADGAKIEVRDVPAMKTLSYTWQGDQNEANVAKAKSALDAALKDRKIEAKGFRMLGYNGPGTPELKRTWELQAIAKQLGAEAASAIITTDPKRNAITLREEHADAPEVRNLIASLDHEPEQLMLTMTVTSKTAAKPGVVEYFLASHGFCGGQVEMVDLSKREGFDAIRTIDDVARFASEVPGAVGFTAHPFFENGIRYASAVVWYTKLSPKGLSWSLYLFDKKEAQKNPGDAPLPSAMAAAEAKVSSKMDEARKLVAEGGTNGVKLVGDSYECNHVLALAVLRLGGLFEHMGEFGVGHCRGCRSVVSGGNPEACGLGVQNKKHWNCCGSTKEGGYCDRWKLIKGMDDSPK